MAQFQRTAAASVPAASAQTDIQGIVGEMGRYLDEMQSLCVDSSFRFWKERRVIYPTLYIAAEDLLAAPASEAYVERIFSLTGLLTARRRNRMSKNLSMRAFLKLNKALFV